MVVLELADHGRVAAGRIAVGRKASSVDGRWRSGARRRLFVRYSTCACADGQATDGEAFQGLGEVKRRWGIKDKQEYIGSLSCCHETVEGS